jgi:uncharacterized RDD family membrane protein YckC
MEASMEPAGPTSATPFQQLLPAGVTLSSPGRRLAGEILDICLIFLLLGIGWTIWLIFSSRQGQSPGHKLLGIRAVSMTTGRSLSHGLTFLRDFFLKGFIGGVTFGIAYLWILWDPNRQALYDKLLTCTVVTDPTGATVGPQPAAPTGSTF